MPLSHVEGSDPALREVIEVEDLKLDVIARSGAMLGQEARLRYPMLADVEAKAGARPRLTSQERVSTAVTRAVEEGPTLEARGVDPGGKLSKSRRGSMKVTRLGSKRP